MIAFNKPCTPTELRTTIIIGAIARSVRLRSNCRQHSCSSLLWTIPIAKIIPKDVPITNPNNVKIMLSKNDKLGFSSKKSSFQQLFSKFPPQPDEVPGA